MLVQLGGKEAAAAPARASGAAPDVAIGLPCGEIGASVARERPVGVDGGCQRQPVASKVPLALLGTRTTPGSGVSQPDWVHAPGGALPQVAGTTGLL